MEIRKPVFVFPLIRIGLLLLCLGFSIIPLNGQTPEQELERVKVAFVYKFLSLVEWNGEDRNIANGNMIIGVAGNKYLNQRFSVISGKFIREREISVKWLNGKNRNNVQGINVLYVSEQHEHRFDDILNLTEDAPILTISEGDRDKLNSCMIVIYERDGYLRFDINNTLARSKGIKLNAKLLELAEKVI
ncbi:MAG: YfiR family protein [Opitutaceae bacterium]